MPSIIASAEEAELIFKFALEAGAALGALGLVTLAAIVIIGGLIAGSQKAGQK
jgi:hypothetical protein